MIHQKDASPPAFWRGGQVGHTILHCKVLEKLGKPARLNDPSERHDRADAVVHARLTFFAIHSLG